MTSDRQFLRLFAQLIIKELVKAAIRKVIEKIMEERLIYDEWTGQPTRVHITGGSADENGVESVVIEGPKEHLGKGIYSSYRHEIPKTMWDKLAPADPTRIRDGAVGKVGDTEMRTGGLVNPVSYVNEPLDKGNHDWKVKGRDFTENFKKGDTFETADRLFQIVDVHANHMDIKNVGDKEVTRVTGLVYDGNGYPTISGYAVGPPSSNLSPTEVRQRLADFQGCALSQIVAFMDVQIDGTGVRDFCFCCGDNDGHELGSPGACVSNKTRMGIDIHVGDIVQSCCDNGRSSGGDGVVVESIIGNGHKVRWNLSGKENWWSTDELEVLSRGEDVITRGGERVFATFKDAAEIHGWKVPGESTSTSSCSCANPACTWRNSFACSYDTFSHLENRGAIE